MTAKNILKIKRVFKMSQDHWVLNVSDVHFDSRKCDRKLLKKHFDEAKKKGADIVINGDWFDVMGMKRDPRSIPNDIRPEYLVPEASYLDLVIEDSYNFLKNYADNILLIGYGNHETNIVKRQQTDPLKRLVQLLNNNREKKVELGAYFGAIILTMSRNKDFSSSLNSTWYYHHGSGGGAKRSKGILNADLLVSQNGWADIITSGHDHQKWHLPFEVLSLNEKTLSWEERRIDILRSGSYKKKSTDFGWEVEKDFNQPTLGGWWVYYRWTQRNNKTTLKTEIKEAK